VSHWPCVTDSSGIFQIRVHGLGKEDKEDEQPAITLQWSMIALPLSFYGVGWVTGRASRLYNKSRIPNT